MAYFVPPGMKQSQLISPDYQQTPLIGYGDYNQQSSNISFCGVCVEKYFLAVTRRGFVFRGPAERNSLQLLIPAVEGESPGRGIKL